MIEELEVLEIENLEVLGIQKVLQKLKGWKVLEAEDLEALVIKKCDNLEMEKLKALEIEGLESFWC